jgi:putative membrane protein
MKKRMSMRIIAALTAVAALVGSGAIRAADYNTETTTPEQRGQLTSKDYKFAKEAAQGGLLEVKLGELAKQKGANQTVQQFGDRMIQDHSKANDQLKQIVSQKGAKLPTQLSRREESELEHMQKLAGKDFDKAYAAHMVKDHQKDIKEFQGAAKNAQDPDLKSFAQSTLPVLEQHSQLAQQMESAVKQQEP